MWPASLAPGHTCSFSGVISSTETHSCLVQVGYNFYANMTNARQELVQLVGDEDAASRLVIEQMNKSADKGES